MTTVSTPGPARPAASPASPAAGRVEDDAPIPPSYGAFSRTGLA